MGRPKKVKTPSRPKVVVGPTARLLTLSDLPPPDTKRWVVRRKGEVVAAVEGGLLSKTEALNRYNITPREYEEWERQYEIHGLPGLRVTKVQMYRDD